MSKEPKQHNQYICLKCMKFWFVGELITVRVGIKKPDSEEIAKTIPISKCPGCRSDVHYCGSHKDRGSPRLFGGRTAHLEYIEARVAESIKQGKRLIYGDSPNLLFIRD